MKLKIQIKHFLRPALLLACMVLLSIAGFSQDPGDNPDGPPPAVPFEDYMHLYILAAGAILAFVTLRKARASKNRVA